MNKNKLLVILAIGLIYLILLPSTIAAKLGPVSIESSFTDISQNDQHYTAIMYLRDHGIISGYPDGTFRPDNVVNRAEALKIILESVNIEGQPAVNGGANANFIDVTDWNAWYYPYLNKATGLGIINGYSDGTFKPEQTVNLAENLKILIAAKNIDLTNFTSLAPYNDIDPSGWYIKHINYAYKYDLITPDSENKIYPDQGMTRGKLAELMYRFLLIKENSIKTTDDKLNVTSSFGTVATKTDLENIWGTDFIKQEESTLTDCPSEPPIVSFETRNGEIINNQIIKEYEESGVKVTIISPEDISLETPEIKGGLELINNWIIWTKNNIYKYPCSQLVIRTHQDFAAGGPGGLGIGGIGGINHYWLLWHELTHGYFGTHSAQSLWLREGASDTLPIIIGEQIINKINWNEQDFATTPKDDTVKNTLKGLSTPGWFLYDTGKIYFVKNACDLKEPDGVGQDYLDNSNWGRTFLIDLAAQFGSTIVTDTLSAIYAKYRYTNLTKISDQDFYDAFMYYINKSVTNTDKSNTAKALLKEKLCL